MKTKTNHARRILFLTALPLVCCAGIFAQEKETIEIASPKMTTSPTFKTYYVPYGMDPSGILMIASTNHTIWAGMMSGLKYYDTAKNKWGLLSRADGLPEQPIKLISGNGNYLWAATQNNILRISTADKSIHTVQSARLPELEITALYAAKEELWVVFKDSGTLFRISAKDDAVSSYQILASTDTVNPPVRLLKDGNYVWALHPNAISRLDIKKGKVKIYGEKELNAPFPTESPILGSYSITANKKAIYFTQLPTIFKFDRKKQSWEVFKYENLASQITASGDYLWAGSSYDTEMTSTFVLSYLSDPGQDWNYSLFLPEPVLDILSYNDSVWIAGYEKLIRFNPKTKRRTDFFTQYSYSITQNEGEAPDPVAPFSIGCTTEMDHRELILKLGEETIKLPPVFHSTCWKHAVYDGQRLWLGTNVTTPPNTPATPQTLYKYDRKMCHWSEDRPGRNGGLPEFPIYMAKASGKLWAETSQGMYSYQDDTWTKEVDGHIFYTTYMDKTIFTLSSQGFFKYSNAEWHRLASPPNLHARLIVLKSGNIFAIAGKSLMLYKAKQNIWLQTDLPQEISSCGEESKGNLWAVAWNDFYKIREENGKLEAKNSPVQVNFYQQDYYIRNWNRQEDAKKPKSLWNRIFN